MREPSRFNLVVSGLHLGDMHGAELARQIRALGLRTPVVLLAFDARQAQSVSTHPGADAVERVFLWQGDAAILLAIVKYIEDRQNVVDDTRTMGVQVILVIEDNIRTYSSFLPMIYGELLRHSRRLISEAVNVSDKIMRMRARPKILLCSTYEEAWDAFVAFEDDVLGVISDIEFPQDGRLSMAAGLGFARNVRERWPDVPVLLQSSNPEHRAAAEEVNAAFLVKGSPTLLADLRRFMVEYFGFGDFVFRTPEGLVVGRAQDLKSLEDGLRTVPAACLSYHAERNHFSSWLKARTEFALAAELRPRRASEFPDGEGLRSWLIAAIAGYRRDRNLQVVADFDPSSFAPQYDFQRLGGGSLGGKARGLAFIRLLLGRQHQALAADAQVVVPGALVLATDLFDRFLDDNDLRAYAIHTTDDDELARRCAAARFPADVHDALAAWLPHVDTPLAVRSSSLLEDSQHQPFAGIYETFMLPLREPSLEERLGALERAIVRVWASTFSRRAKDTFAASAYRLEEEKMAVILQRVMGAAHGPRFYPDISGVARSHNFYPSPPMTAADGVAAVALGLGRSVTSEGNCLRFCPRYPQHLLQMSSVRDALASSQRELWALDLTSSTGRETRYELEDAEADGTLAPLASTYSHDNHAIYDGTSRPGVRLITFASVLKHGEFPLAPLLVRLLALGQWGMGTPVELEFACDLARRELAVLQLRP
ncbi:MAG: histidine kinase, partial [Myxococcales bacterium]|nr:histidine kinase [Myxococcales bacterium]